MKKTVLALCISVVSLMAFAHEFWLSPQKFFYSIREVANIRFVAGENFTGENWLGNKTKVQQLLQYTPSGDIINLLSRLSDNNGDSLSLPLQETGTQMVIFHSTNSFIELDADKFNAYLKEDGLDKAAAFRRENKEENNPGKEYYQHSVKTIFQVSDKLTDACTKPTSLPLDIIPEINPYTLPENISKEGLLKVKFQVLFMGKPLENALVKVWYHLPGKIALPETLRTGKKGWIITERHPGPVMVSCTHIERNTSDTVANWQSYRSSLSFEYSQFFPRLGRN